MATLKSDVFAPDITWNLPGHHPLSGIKRGPDEVIAFFAALMGSGVVVEDVHFGTMEEDGVVERHTATACWRTARPSTSRRAATTASVTAGSTRCRSTRATKHNVDRYFWAVNPLKPIPDRLG